MGTGPVRRHLQWRPGKPGRYQVCPILKLDVPNSVSEIRYIFKTVHFVVTYKVFIVFVSVSCFNFQGKRVFFCGWGGQKRH